MTQARRWGETPLQILGFREVLVLLGPRDTGQAIQVQTLAGTHTLQNG